MIQMMKYEIKKILYRKSAKFAVGALVGWLIFSILFTINETSWVLDNGETINGVEAIRISRLEKSKWNGALTEEVVAKVIEKNHQISNDDKYKVTGGGLSNIGWSYTQEFEDIRDLIVKSFSGFYPYNYYIVDNLKPEQSEAFYSNRIDKLEEWLNDETKGHTFNNDEKIFFMNCAEGLKEPFYYSYMDGWENALNYTSMILFLLIITICIILAPTFSMEYETGSDAVFLSTKNGRDKGIKAKLFSAYALATALYWGEVLVFNGIILSIYGFDGADCIIQTNSYGWKSYYQLTNKEAMWLLMILGYVGCLMMSSITLWMSARFKTAFGSIILAFIVLIIPFMLDINSMPEFVEDIFNLMPHQTIGGLQLLQMYSIYNILGVFITPPQMIIMLYLVGCLILIIMMYKTFKKPRVKKDYFGKLSFYINR